MGLALQLYWDGSTGERLSFSTIFASQDAIIRRVVRGA